jgi:hypothetical protein
MIKNLLQFKEQIMKLFISSKGNSKNNNKNNRNNNRILI